MLPILGLLLLAVAGSCADPAPTTVASTTTTVAPLVAEKSHNGCSLYCFITPRRDERVDFALYSNLSCTHFVYGFGQMTDEYQYQGPSYQDEVTHSYSGNFYHLRSLKRANPSASILLGVHLAEHDSLISYPPTREKLAYYALKEARSLHADGLFFRVGRPFIDNSRFAHFFKDLSSANNTLPVTLGVPMPLISHSIRHILDATPHVDKLYVVSSPSMHSLAHVDPLLPTEATPPEQTISYHVEELVAKGVPKRKIVVGLTTGAVVYTNYIVHNVNEEADGRLAALQETCGWHGERMLDAATASEMFKYKQYTWVSSNAPVEAALGKKVRWLTSAGYGGIGLQSLQNDDPKAECDKEGVAKFPALRMAAANMECRPEQYVKSCNRLCYINSPKPLDKLAPTDCSHIVIEATLSALGEVKLSADATEMARWMRNWHVAQKPKLMISLGARATNDIWRIALAVPYYRQQAVKQLKELMIEWRASGVEVSWTMGNLELTTDSTYLNTLMVEMREALGTNTTIALAVTFTAAYRDRYTEMPKLDETVDLIILHSHRFHSAASPFTGHHSPLFYTSDIIPDMSKSVEGMVAHWITTQKMARSKIIVGITAEPLSQNLNGVDRADPSPYNMAAQPANPYLRSDDGKKAVNGKRVCEMEKDGSSRKEFISTLAVPFLVNGAQFVAYENERSVQMKTTWTSLNQLGGIALFDVQLDDPHGECAEKPFPLLKAIVKTQVCETCVREDVGGLPCTDPFTNSCSYRLPTATTRDPMPSAKIPYSLCTQIVIEQVWLRADGSISFNDDTAKSAMTVLAQPQVGMKRLIASVHCHPEMSKKQLDELLNDGPSMVRTLLSFMTNYSLNGVELVCDHLIDADRKRSFSSFLAGLRSALRESTPLKQCPRSLSLRLPFNTLDLYAKYDMDVLNSIHHVVLEPFNDPNRDDVAHVNSPLFSANGHHDDIDTTIRAWKKAGLEKSKIILQIPAYATLQDINSNVTEIGAAATHPMVINQAQVCAFHKNHTKSTMMWDRISAYSVVSEPSSSRLQWMSTQNQDTIAYKIFYAIREGLAGTALRTLNEDDWAGRCGSGPFPLLTAAKARCAANQLSGQRVL